MAPRRRRHVLTERALLLVLAAVVALAVVTLAAPLRTYLAGRDRLDLLQMQQQALAQDNQRLTRRVADLNDPNHIELLAREQLGLVKPGEVPYVIITPERDRPLVAARPRASVALPWYERLWQDLFG